MMSHKWLLAQRRVFFDKRSGKAERIEQFIAEHGIEYGCQFVTLFFINPPDCLYTKKSCKFLQSYEKSREMQKESLLFFCRFLLGAFASLSHSDCVTLYA
jgi:hypothetical protein